MIKRVVLPLVIVLILAGAVVYFQRGAAAHSRQVAALLPGRTILFADAPDIQRTQQRWPATALAQILAEPEVQTFLQRPLSEVPYQARTGSCLARIALVNPTHAFLAVTDASGAGIPKTIAGFSFTGSKAAADSLVDDLRKAARETWPDGRGNVEQYGSGEIETFSSDTFSAAFAFRGKWLFISTDTALLKETLDRFDGKSGADSLAQLPQFKTCLQQLPGGPDGLLFVRPGQMADKLAAFSMMLNPTIDTGGTNSLSAVDAAGMVFKIDGELIRDAAFVIKSQPGDTTPLARDALKISSTDTILASDERMPTFGDARWLDTKADPTGVLQMINSYLKTFTDQGLGSQQLQQAFGPDVGFVLDWPGGAMIPTPCLLADVRDAAMARKFLDALSTFDFVRQDLGGLTLYSMPQTGIGFFPLQATVGFNGKCAIAGLSVDAVQQAAKRWSAGSLGLAATPDYQKMSGLVAEPTLSFTYVDTKGIFDRLYGLFRGVASMGFIPHLSHYVDVAKLPAPETISRHLSPMVASSAARDGGVLYESAGPVTMTQATVVTAAIFGAAMIPIVEQQLQGQSVTLPGFQNPFSSVLSPAPSAATPTPQPAPATPAASPAASPR